MSKKHAITLLVVLTMVGSVICFYATNLVLSDIANMFYMTLTKDCISSLPILLVALDFVLAAIAAVRLYMRPQYRKRAALLYTRILFGFSLAGVITSILTGTMIYGSFTTPYPFPCATLLVLLWHAAGIFAAFRVNALVRKTLPEDPEKRVIRPYYIAYSVFLSVLIFFSYNRFGALLLAPIYAQRSTLGLTWPFYLSLLLPLALCFHVMFYMFRLEERYPEFGIWYSALILAADVFLAATVFFAMEDTRFISAVSPAVAIERLLTMPIDTILHFSLVFLLALYCLWYSIKQRKKNGNGR